MSTKPKCNREITASEIRLIDDQGNMIGISTTEKGLQLAEEKGLDLVEISPGANPPVCKVMDYGKYNYELQKKAKDARKKQKTVDVKEIKVRPNIADGDYNVKLKKAKKFIEQGDKVRVSLMFRGREITHDEVGFSLIARFKEDMEEISKVELEPKKEGRQIFMILTPK